MPDYGLAARLYEPLLEPLVRGFRRAGLELAPPSPGMRVLDLGCGTGAHLALYRSAGAVVSGVDRSPSMLARARTKLGGNATLIEADATAVPLDDGGFDLVLIMTLLHELEPGHAAMVLHEAKRLIGPKGRVLVIDHHPGAPRGLRGWLIRMLGNGIEGAARHPVRRFRRIGGVPALVGRSGLEVAGWSTEAAGTMGLYLLRSQRAAER